MGTAIDNQNSSNPEQEGKNDSSPNRFFIVCNKQIGIIPRAMSTLFQRLNDMQKQSASTTNFSKRAPSVISTFPPSSGLRAPRRSTSTVKLRPVSMMTPPRRSSSSNIAINNNNTNEKATKYTVHVSFIEIYNEELIDLLNPAHPSERTPVTIREDTKGHIIWSGLKEVPVSNTEDVLR